MATSSSTSTSSGPVLAPLSSEEFKEYNRMAEHMEIFHNSFRQNWSVLWAAVSPTDTSTSTSTTTPRTLSASRIITVGLSFMSKLSMHHDIEETHIFPMLATRMPAFRPDAPALQQHREIHSGMDKLEGYLRECQKGQRDLRREEVRERMEGWGEVLWRHLDDEVWELGAERMRACWTLGEVRRMGL